MNKAMLFILAMAVIIAGYDALLNLQGAAVVSGTTECDDTMVLILNPAETAAGDSIFVSSYVQQRTPLKSGRFSERLTSQKWIVQGHDSCKESQLTEWSCSATAQAISKRAECKYGCTLGHCILPTCYDPDIATPFTVAATTTGIMLTEPQFKGVPPQTQDAQEYADYCSSDLILTEYSCIQVGGGSQVKAQQKSCKNLGNSFKCIEGRCVSPELKG